MTTEEPDGTGILYGSYEAFNNQSLYTEDSYYKLIAPVAPYSEAAVGTKAYCMPLAVYSKDISYEYDSVSKVLTANINDWSFNTNLQVVVPFASNTNAYTGGVANADGVAFYFAAAYSSSFQRAMTLYNFKTKVEIGQFTTASFATNPAQLKSIRMNESYSLRANSFAI